MITQEQAKSMIVSLNKRWNMRMTIDDRTVLLWQRELSRAGADEHNARKLFDGFVRSYESRWNPRLNDLVRYVRFHLPPKAPAGRRAEPPLTPDLGRDNVKRIIAKHFPQMLTPQERKDLGKEDPEEPEKECDVPDDQIPY